MESAFDLVLERARGGDPDALGQLWNALNDRLERFLWLRARDAAADIASETWVSAMRNLADFSGTETQFRAWLFTIGRRRLIDWQRREARTSLVCNDVDTLASSVSGDDPEADVLGRMSAAAALALLAELSPAQAEVVALRVLADLDVEHVAAVLGKSPGSVRVLQHRGLRALRARLEAPRSSDRGVAR